MLTWPDGYIPVRSYYVYFKSVQIPSAYKESRCPHIAQPQYSTPSAVKTENDEVMESNFERNDTGIYNEPSCFGKVDLVMKQNVSYAATQLIK